MLACSKVTTSIIGAAARNDRIWKRRTRPGQFDENSRPFRSCTDFFRRHTIVIFATGINSDILRSPSCQGRIPGSPN